MLGLKLNHISKMGYWSLRANQSPQLQNPNLLLYENRIQCSWWYLHGRRSFPYFQATWWCSCPDIACPLAPMLLQPPCTFPALLSVDCIANVFPKGSLHKLLSVQNVGNTSDNDHAINHELSIPWQFPFFLIKKRCNNFNASREITYMQRPSPANERPSCNTKYAYIPVVLPDDHCVIALGDTV